MHIRKVAGRTHLIWATIGCIFAVDVVWLSFTLLSVERTGIVRAGAATGLLVAIAVFYSISRRSDAISRTAHAGAQWIAFSAVGVVLSYLVTSTHAPLADHLLLSADLRFGFDWIAWTAWVDRNVAIHWFVAISYWALFPEMILCLLWLPLAGSADELIGLLIVGAITTIAFSGLMPAIGHLPHASQVAQVIALRSGSLREIPLSHPEGLIAFPSFHIALAAILAYASRKTRWLFPLTCILGVAIAISVPSEGGHYMIDVIGGFAVALFAAKVIPASWAIDPVPDTGYEIAERRMPASGETMPAM
jgi:membrane-associated phospholipid phosphatase